MIRGKSHSLRENPKLMKLNEVKFSLLLSVVLLFCNSFEISKQRVTIARVRQCEAKPDKVCQRLARSDIVRQKNRICLVMSDVVQRCLTLNNHVSLCLAVWC